MEVLVELLQHRSEGGTELLGLVCRALTRLLAGSCDNKVGTAGGIETVLALLRRHYQDEPVKVLLRPLCSVIVTSTAIDHDAKVRAAGGVETLEGVLVRHVQQGPPALLERVCTARHNVTLGDPLDKKTVQLLHAASSALTNVAKHAGNRNPNPNPNLTLTPLAWRQLWMS